MEWKRARSHPSALRAQLPAGRLSVVAVSTTDVRDQRLFKQLRALEVLGHQVTLIAPKRDTNRFVAISGFETFPGEVFGMKLPEGSSMNTRIGVEKNDITTRRPSAVRRAAGAVVGGVVTAIVRYREAKRYRIWVREAITLLRTVQPQLIMVHRQRLAQEILRFDWGSTPVVVDLHELPKALHGGLAELQPAGDLRRLRRARRRIVQTLRRADLVTSEEGIDQHLVGQFELDVLAIPNAMLPAGSAGSDTVSSGADQESVREILGLAEDQHVIVYLGFYLPNRGVEALIAAFEHLPSSYHLALVVGWTGRTLVPHVQASSVSDRLHLMDLVTQDRLVDLLRGSDLGIYLPDPPTKPHAMLCMPTKLYEFHAAEVPVLVADDPGLKEFAERYGGVLVLDRPFTPATVARWIEAVVEHRPDVPVRTPPPDLMVVMRSVLESLGWRQTVA